MPTDKTERKKKRVKSAPAKAQQKSQKKKISPKIASTTSALPRRTALKSPHKSFRRTYRRDYAHPSGLPSYFGFTLEVWKLLWRYKKTFIMLTVICAIFSSFIVGMISQEFYNNVGDLIRSTGGEMIAGNTGKITEAGLLLAAGLSGGLNATLSEAQQLMVSLLILFFWLVTIWILRALLAGHVPKLRDGFYNAGAPIVPTFILGLVFMIQLVPMAIAAIAVSTLLPAGFVSGGIEAMLFWVVALLLILLTLYWVVATLFALVMVTLPGMYPFKALRTAQDLVAGRRLPLVLRILWLFLTLAGLWIIIMIPIILFDAWLKGVLQNIGWLPIVPVAWLLMSSATLVFSTSYIYLLYRKVVDSDVITA